MSDNPYRSPHDEDNASVRIANPWRYEWLSRIVILFLLFFPTLLGFSIFIVLEILSYFR